MMRISGWETDGEEVSQSSKGIGVVGWFHRFQGYMGELFVSFFDDGI
jgi:hypothetical protein